MSILRKRSWKRRIQVFREHLSPSMIDEVEENKIDFNVGYDADGMFVGEENIKIGTDGKEC